MDRHSALRFPIHDFQADIQNKAVPACLATLAIMICLLPAAVSAAPDQGPIPEYTEFEQLSGCNIGMITGAPFEELVRSKIPDAGPVLYYNSPADLVTALKAGKVEAYFNSNAVGSLQVNQDSSLAIFPHSLGETNFGFAFKKNSKERQRWERAFSTISEEEKQKIWKKWTGADESAKVLPEQDWPGTAGTVRVAACDTLPPMSYRGPGGKLVGFDIEIILRMAKELDVHVEFKGMEFSAVLPSVESGMAPMGTGSIVVSAERKEVVDFIEYHPASYVLVVRSLGNEETGVGFFSGLKQSSPQRQAPDQSPDRYLHQPCGRDTGGRHSHGSLLHCIRKIRPFRDHSCHHRILDHLRRPRIRCDLEHA